MGDGSGRRGWTWMLRPGRTSGWPGGITPVAGQVCARGSKGIAARFAVTATPTPGIGKNNSPLLAVYVTERASACRARAIAFAGSGEFELAMLGRLN